MDKRHPDRVVCKYKHEAGVMGELGNTYNNPGSMKTPSTYTKQT